MMCRGNHFKHFSALAFRSRLLSSAVPLRFCRLQIHGARSSFLLHESLLDSHHRVLSPLANFSAFNFTNRWLVLRKNYQRCLTRPSESVFSIVLSSTVLVLEKVVAEDGSILAPPHLKIAPWADEEGLGLTDYKTGRARVVTPDKRVALTLRCLPLPGEIARLIEAHPNEVQCRDVALSVASEAAVCVPSRYDTDPQLATLAEE